VQRYLDETYGDSQYTLSVLHAYAQKASSSAHSVNLLKYKESKISSKRIIAQYSLPACDEQGFKTFSRKFDDVTKAAVLDIYGKFSEFTTPILSLDKITELANVFQAQIPRYYEMISTLLNREQYSRLKRSHDSKLLWDHFILYTFCMLMRIRNKNNFSWWALINSASMYGNGANHLAVFFGFR
jgi:hypothetical protein